MNIFSPMTTQNPSSSIKTRFTYRFIRALKKVNKSRSGTSQLTTRKMVSRRIKMAADASMASAVGSRSAWSRAILWKIRKRAVIRRRNKKKNNIRIRIKSLRRISSKKRGNPRELFGSELRKIIPGGESMNMLNLLDETAHYVKCLTTQVQVMRNIAELYSTT